MKSTFFAESRLAPAVREVEIKTRSKQMAVGNNLALKGLSPGMKIAVDYESPWAGDALVAGDAAHKAQSSTKQKSKLA